MYLPESQQEKAAFPADPIFCATGLIKESDQWEPALTNNKRKLAWPRFLFHEDKALLQQNGPFPDVILVHFLFLPFCLSLFTNIEREEEKRDLSSR